MFTGLIKIIGTVVNNTGSKITVLAKGVHPHLGDSIAIHGVCLTVVSYEKHKSGWKMQFDVSEETLDKTTLNTFKKGDVVHVEPALRASDTLGGHIVQGHVDGVGKVVKIESQPASHVMTFSAPPDIQQYLVPKGSITIDGISLTVADLMSKNFTVAVIPFTWEHTTLHNKKVNDSVNLEADVMAKYVARYIKK